MEHKATTPPNETTKVCDEHGEFISQTIRLGTLSTQSSCPSCAAARAKNKKETERIANLSAQLNRLGIPERYKIRYKDLRVTAENQSTLEKTKQLIQAIIRGDFHNIFFIGNIGAGKTQIMLSAACELRIKGKEIKVTEFSQITADVEQQYIHRQEISQMIKPYQQVDILMVDELRPIESAKKPTIQQAWFDIINYRHNHEKPTFFCSNYTEQQIKQILTAPCIDRLYEAGTVFNFTWDSMRRGNGDR